MPQLEYGHLTSRMEDGVLILTLTDKAIQGERLTSTIRQELLDAVKESGARLVVIDFRNVAYVASMAFRPLLSLRRLVHDLRGRMAVSNLSPFVLEVFTATRMLISTQAMTATFEHYADAADAVAALREPVR
jgi:anti-anti-sigma factor